MEKTEKVRLWTKYFVVLFFAEILIAVCMQLYNTATPLFVDYLGGSTSYSGLLVTVFTISATLMRIFSGRALDKKGRRSLIVLGLLIFTAASFSFRVGILGYLPVARFLQGAGYSLASTGISVAVADVLPRQRMGEGIGYFGLAFSLTSAVGPAMAMVLCGGDHYERVFYSAAVLALACAVLIHFLARYETDTAFARRKAAWEAQATGSVPEIPQSDARGIWKFFEKRAIKPTLVSLFINLPSAATISFLMLFAKHHEIPNASLFFTINALCLVGARLLFSRAADRFHPLVTVGPALVLGATGYWMILLGPKSAILFFVAAGLIGLATGLSSPTLNALVIRRAPASRRGAASATFLMSTDVGIGIGSFLWGLLIDLTGFQMVFTLCGVSMFVALVLALLWLRSDS